MKNLLFKSIVVCILMLINANEASAQGILKKLKKSSDKVESTDNTNNESADTTGVKQLNWEMVPEYHAETRPITSNDGTPLKNEDGSPMVCVLLVDQFGNVRSADVVKEQHKKLNQYINNILKEVGKDAAVGAVTGLAAGKKGALIGGAAGVAHGVIASKDDIKKARELKKSLKEQEEILAKYQKNFTSEGTPIDASVDISKIDGLEIKEGVSMTAEALKAELASIPDDSNWNLEEIKE